MSLRSLRRHFRAWGRQQLYSLFSSLGSLLGHRLGTLMTVLVLGIAMSMSFPFMNAAVMAGAAFTLLVGSVWFNFQLWANYKLDFSLVLLMLVIIMVTSVTFRSRSSYPLRSVSRPCSSTTRIPSASSGCSNILDAGLACCCTST